MTSITISENPFKLKSFGNDLARPKEKSICPISISRGFMQREIRNSRWEKKMAARRRMRARIPCSFPSEFLTFPVFGFSDSEFFPSLHNSFHSWFVDLFPKKDLSRICDILQNLTVFCELVCASVTTWFMPYCGTHLGFRVPRSSKQADKFLTSRSMLRYAIYALSRRGHFFRIYPL